MTHPATQGVPGEGEALRILHLEDSELDHELVTMHVETDLPWSVEITRVEDEPGFLHALSSAPPHLILSDFALPSYDGLSAYRAAHQRLPKVPFIIVTGAMGEETAVDTLREGVTDYILKQRLERLAPSIRRAIAEVESRIRRERAEQEIRQLNASLQARLEEVERLRNTAERQSQRLEIQARQLEEALNLQKTFLAETSHELRTPLTALHGYLRRAEREAGGSQTLLDAQRVAENMTRLVNDLLRDGQAQTGRPGLLATVELVEDAGFHGVRHAGATVHDPHLQFAGAGHDLQPDLVGAAGHADGVGDEVDEHLVQAAGVADDLVHAVRGVHAVVAAHLPQQLPEVHEVHLDALHEFPA